MRKNYGTNGAVIDAYLRRTSYDGRSGTGNLYFEGDTLYSYGEHFPLAVRRDGYYIVNGDRYSATTSSKHQSPLFRKVPNWKRLEIPFSALENMATLTGWRKGAAIAREIDVVDWEPDRYLYTGRTNKYGVEIQEHVLGGCLFRYGGRTYVTGMDQTGVGREGRFFLTELAQAQIDKYGTPTTVAEAMELLKPEAVREAEAQGVKVERQGEHFFIEVKDTNFEVGEVHKQYMIKNVGEDREDRHYASEGFMRDGVQFVRGIVKHTRKEHRQLKLYETGTKPKDRSWFRQYESIQTNSWAASGNVD